MEANSAYKLVPREIGAMLSNERLIRRQTQRALTPHGDPVAIAEPHRPDGHFHGVSDGGVDGGPTVRSAAAECSPPLAVRRIRRCRMRHLQERQAEG